MEWITKKTIWLAGAGLLLLGVAIGYVIAPSGSSGHEDHAQAGTVEEWTCSMHPQIRQSEPGKCPLCGMDLIPASKSGSGERNPFVLELTEEALALANVQTTKVRRQLENGGIVLSGKIRVNEERKSSLTAKFPGRLEQLYVNYTGQVVRKGERLASVYSPELIAAQKELQEAVKWKDRNPGLYRAAREKLKYWKLSDAQIDRVEASGEWISTFDVYSDVSGVVMSLQVSVGDFVSTGTVLAEIADLSTVWVVMDAYESDLGSIRKGQKLQFTTPGVPGKSFEATIDYLQPTLNDATRSVEVRARVANAAGELRPEMFVTASLAGATSGRSQVAVPRSAVLWTGPRSIVYVKVPDTEIPAFEMREVKLGQRAGEFYLIEAGLSEGEEVVSNGVFAVDGAAQLSGNYSMMMTAQVKTLEVDEEFIAQLDAVVDAYLALKQALVASDASLSTRHAQALGEALGKVRRNLLTSEGLEYWKQLQPTMKKSAADIAQSQDLEAMRSTFSVLSDHLIEAVERFGTLKAAAYKSYCPMAENDAGAYWLTTENEIRNPYFGSAMLVCGEITQTYRKGQRVLGGDHVQVTTPSTQEHQH
jgi:membrane fusion protein, copper/silver efflux system